jgi:hypothetical protein
MYHEKLESVEMIIKALGANYPSLQSLAIIQYPRPKERLVYPKYTQEEILLAETLRKGGVDSGRITDNLIWRIRGERWTRWTNIWWQSKGYHCSFDYGISIYGET